METVLNISEKVIDFVFNKKEYCITILISILIAETIGGFLYIKSKNEAIHVIINQAKEAKESCSNLIQEKKDNYTTMINNLNTRMNEQRIYYENELKRLNNIMIERRAYNKEVNNFLNKKGKIVDNILENINLNLNSPEKLDVKQEWIDRIEIKSDE